MRYAAVILDLDGVVYVGDEAVPHAIASLNDLASHGTVLAAATNNANRPADVVAAHLQSLGLRIAPDHVMTSAQAAAHHVAAVLEKGAPVLAVGGDGVADALVDAGLTPIRASEDLAACDRVADTVLAIVVGYGPKVAWYDLATAHWAIERGKPWFATNTDATVPLPYGRAPGNGAMVGLLARSTGVEPTVIGKPQRAIFDALAEKLKSRNLLVVGDRLDTDIDGAIAAGMDSLLVLTGVHGPAELVERRPDSWPSFIAADLRSLQESTVRVSGRPDALRADSQHPWVVALVNALSGGKCDLPCTDLEAPPLVDLRGVRTGSVGP